MEQAQEDNVRDDSISVGASNVVCSYDTQPRKRRAWSCVNTSTGGQRISLAYGKDAVDGAGIVLYPGGDAGEAIDSVFCPTAKRISAISSAAGGTLAWHEVSWA